MRKNHHLFFLALIPHEPVLSDIKRLKLECAKRFEAKKALNSPAHITVQRPFKRTDRDISYIIKRLKLFSSKITPFQLELNGFSSFPPRVIFVNINQSKPLQQFYNNLKQVLTEECHFSKDEIQSKFHPHITLATRDLKKISFQEALNYFSGMKYSGQFIVNKLSLLKHNGKFWDIYEEFLFE